jgi:hypothetical protein
MKFDITSVLAFIIGLAVFVGLILAATLFAQWIRTKITGAPSGRFLAKAGFAQASGSIYDLRKGVRYLVTRSFVDHYGGKFEAGECLTFLSHDYLPYHGGHTVKFIEKTLYLQDEADGEIVQRIWDYLKPQS